MTSISTSKIFVIRIINFITSLSAKGNFDIGTKLSPSSQLSTHWPESREGLRF